MDLNDILAETISFDKQNINYILVYNKAKNSNYALKTTLAKRAGKSFLIGGFSRYDVFFHDVKTVNDDEFKKHSFSPRKIQICFLIIKIYKYNTY